MSEEMEPQIPSRASEGRRHVCPAGIRKPLRKVYQTTGMQSIPEHHVNWGIGLRGFPLPKGIRDADERRFVHRGLVLICG